MTIIDVHTHAFTREFMDVLKANGDIYNLQTRPDGQIEIFRHDTPVAIPQAGHFDYELRLRDMDRWGIDISVVSLTCPNVYWGGEETSAAVARQSNASMAAAKKKWPDRIRWFSSLPFEYPARAVEELKRSVEEGAAGVMVLANIGGRSLTDELFAPVWEAIDARALPVLVHPTDLPGIDRMDMRKYDLSWSVGFMADTTIAFARLIFDGFLDTYPRLKLIASHGGGTLPYLVGRFDKGDEVELPSRRRMKAKPSEYLKRIWYDCITYDARALDYLISVAGHDRVLFGTDYPHWVHDVNGSLAHTAALPAHICEAIRQGNARTMMEV